VAGDWREDKLDELNRFALDNSDVITYHEYRPFKDLKAGRIAAQAWPAADLHGVYGANVRKYLYVCLAVIQAA